MKDVVKTILLPNKVIDTDISQAKNASIFQSYKVTIQIEPTQFTQTSVSAFSKSNSDKKFQKCL